jgi:hypothetical protein
MALRKGRLATAAQVAASVSFKIPKRSVGKMRISITRGTKNCQFVGTSIRGVRVGKCTIVVILLPKKGKSTMRTNSLTIKR